MWTAQNIYGEEDEKEIESTVGPHDSSEISIFYLTKFSLGFSSQVENNLDFLLTTEKK